MADARRLRRPVVVHNADGVNPYGTEVAALLQRAGRQVLLVDACNSPHAPPAGITWRRLLPANFGPRTRLVQAARLARGLGATVWAGLVRGEVVLVASVGFPVENVALAALAALGRPVVLVQHDPVRRRSESRLSRWGRRQVLLRSTVAVVHSERLRGEVDRAASDHLLVCPHPPYSVTAAAPAGDAAAPNDGRRWIAFIGALRPDKGIQLLPEILSRVPLETRRELGLIVCGRGALSADAWKQLSDLQIMVRDLTSPEPVAHEVLLDVLAQRPLVLAPYVAATQSGSVILALSMGCPVLAFDKGAIPDVLTPEGLVPNGDLGAFAEAVAAGRAGTARLPLEAWVDSCVGAWSDAVDQAVSQTRR